MHESFGARLRRHREEQHIALVTIAEQTKIKLSLLEELERDDISHWPAGIFRRAFVRSYASALNLDPNTVVQEFAEAHPVPVDVASAAAIAAAIEREGADGKMTSRFRTLMGSLGFARSTAPEEAPPAVEKRDPVVPPAVAMREERPGQPPEPAREMALEVAPQPVKPLREPVVAEPDFMAFAHLCTDFARVDRADDVPRLLREVAKMMDASGLIVWVWDAAGKELRPAMTHGYSSRVVAQLPGVCREDDNATAAAFRSGQPCVINGSDQCSAALVLPLMAPGGSAGVLAIELQQGRRLTKPIRAVATIFAALMAQLVGGVGASEEETLDHEVSIDHPLAALNG